MGVAFKDLGAVPVLVPVPEFDSHVVRGGEDVGEGGVDLHVPDVVLLRWVGGWVGEER